MPSDFRTKSTHLQAAYYLRKPADRPGFFRIHHSYLINLSHLKAFVRSEGGAVKMHNGDLLPVSRQKKGELMDRFL
ncbi:MAG: LytTR family transcriptional regulator [Cytophagaceae bacterium]|nr:LytTR family transcriptional regulator [Cytophagaceae bacterium]